MSPCRTADRLEPPRSRIDLSRPRPIGRGLVGACRHRRDRFHWPCQWTNTSTLSPSIKMRSMENSIEYRERLSKSLWISRCTWSRPPDGRKSNALKALRSRSRRISLSDSTARSIREYGRDRLYTEWFSGSNSIRPESARNRGEVDQSRGERRAAEAKYGQYRNLEGKRVKQLALT